MIDKVGAVILKDKKILVQRKKITEKNVLSLVVKERIMKLILRL